MLYQQSSLLIVPFWNWNSCSLTINPFFAPLLIVPFWNWNSFVCGILVCFSTAFNRTILELKHTEVAFVWAGLYLLIVPFWNWNQRNFQKRQMVWRLLIVPFWNWNFRILSLNGEKNLLLIVPFWNWNPEHGLVHRIIYNPFNRTILELKLSA